MWTILNKLRYPTVKFIEKIRNVHSFSTLNIDYLCNPQNLETISENITHRKGIGNITLVQNLYKQLKTLEETDSQYEQLKSEFISEALKIPNDTHKDVWNYGTDPKLVKSLGTKPSFKFEPKQFHEITKYLNLMRTDQLGNVTGSKSYYFLGALAELEQALVRYTVGQLLKVGFHFFSVPDILPSGVIDGCGMNTSGERTQIYSLEQDPNLCLSGTSELALAGYFQNKIIPNSEFPKRIAAVSRCYRAETSSIAEERGIYRVHQFTKVEMFAMTRPNESESMLDEFRAIQEQHFTNLGLHLRVLDMPPHELGAPAFRKYDLEAYLPGRDMFGEISSCSNCTDFQARRLNIKNEDGECVHTVNGTACAVPRMLIALLETYQTEQYIQVPEVLKPYVRFEEIVKNKSVPELKLKKFK